MKHDRYRDTLDYLYQQLPMYQRIGPAALKPGLGNIRELCWSLGLPQWRFRSLHIAGTNGKGSVSSMLAAVLHAAGFRTGLYTSPHLADFTERIRIGGAAIQQEAVVAFVDRCRSALERIQPSFFETTVAMAFDYFARSEVDVAVIETGLGGRLDSTNLIRPELSIITNISWDHMDLLGDTLALIAGEKAGIIKRFTPVVIGQRHPETEEVFLRKAAELEAPVRFAEDCFRVERLGGSWRGQQFRVEPLADPEPAGTYGLSLAGLYQAENLRTVLAAVAQLREDGWSIPDEALRDGLLHVRAYAGLRGRMEPLGESPLILCDTGHNEAGIAAVLEQLREIPCRQQHLVWGMASDKDHARILRMLPQAARYYFVRPDVPRGLDAGVLRDKAAGAGLHGDAHGSVADGIAAAQAAAGPEDLIFIGGSTFVVAEALPLFPEA
ncbi:MAG: folylpolyglutamate synthase/dihydrofolate synthase family protein [Bacteroidia bacterium]|nr:folylpolyglutamate synthase/dihydrofolate synthase family protein [Bacteroidia bacterium]